ncbi:M48 family metalloprotease [Roseivirga pacifica]|uniref:M48 family metalloprotease n=1 Tax=Roseivirga pacifica TaxID=1267423 RepID=UPI00209612E1|nr:M48 family metallopeptidase [Roseivirga pacifica]MCO6360958.1 M48 family metalloprotease [Roseivirga pacifica]MCO6368847.1 M48 family metalloprotease [Roseivirga pacifica]MCO6372991.1 M48 family metalloprotease [Roseivirga pacifica]MCO6377051.1 M48 family metalloprotease [Roseivirga pacifica]MCO6377672.1 M48 family metalloprotease [Roseivirga pacifica]
MSYISKDFKNASRKAILSLVFFAICYLLIVLLTLGIAAAAVFGAYLLVVSFPRFITLALGVGILGFAVIIVLFLFKFLGKNTKQDLSHLHEIKGGDNPLLFAMLDELVKNINTKFPKRVFLSYDVNASVFFNSSFWSMFFPVKKNLQIGLGLINTVTEAELKAILAHEFGHFSQKEMKIGSYVYNVNQVIHNLLFENDSFDDTVERWAGISSYFSIFVIPAVKVISAVKWLLVKLYTVVNKTHLALSREMEFHADAIAAETTSPNSLKTGLLRLELSETALSSGLSIYNIEKYEAKRSENIYPEQTYVMQFLAKQRGVEILNDLPLVSLSVYNSLNNTKLVIKDQWASHPSIEDRINSLDALKINHSHEDKFAPAKLLLGDHVQLEKHFTEELFSHYPNKTEVMNFEDFKGVFVKEYNKSSLPSTFNGYYDNKAPLVFDIPTSLKQLDISIESLFNDDMVAKVIEQTTLENDINTLEHIANKNISTKTFDYDGKKYNRKEAKKLIGTLRTAQDKLKEQILVNDVAIFEFFLQREADSDREESLKRLYSNYFEFESKTNNRLELYFKASNALQFINERTQHNEIKVKLMEFEPIEKALKAELSDLYSKEYLKVELTKEAQKKVDIYLAEKLAYFGKKDYFHGNLEILFTSLEAFISLLNAGHAILKNEIVNYQASLIGKKETA